MKDEELCANPALAVWWHLARTFALVSREAERIITRATGLTGPQMGVLRCIDEAGGSLHLGQIGERMLVTCGNITGVVDRLERDGFVVRERSVEDRRVILARITPEGREISLRARDALTEHMAGLLDFMTAAEHQELARQLERIHLYLKERTSP